MRTLQSRGPISETSDLHKSKLALSRTIASYLIETGTLHSSLAASKEDPISGLAEPSGECRRIMNTWMAKCVFGPPKE